MSRFQRPTGSQQRKRCVENSTHPISWMFHFPFHCCHFTFCPYSEEHFWQVLPAKPIEICKTVICCVPLFQDTAVSSPYSAEHGIGFWLAFRFLAIRSRTLALQSDAE